MIQFNFSEETLGIIINFSEETLGIRSLITTGLIILTIIIGFPGTKRSRQLWTNTLDLFLLHFVVIGYVLQGKMFWAGLWVILIMVTFWTRNLIKRNIEMKGHIDEMKQEINEKIIQSVAKRFGLSAEDFELRTEEDKTYLYYKDELWDESKHKNLEDEA